MIIYGIPFVLGLTVSDIEQAAEELERVEEEYKYYVWEEQDYKDNRLMYEYGLEHLEELSKREKM